MAGADDAKFRLLPTGLQNPRWLGFFARGDAKTEVKTLHNQSSSLSLASKGGAVSTEREQASVTLPLVVEAPSGASHTAAALL